MFGVTLPMTAKGAGLHHLGMKETPLLSSTSLSRLSLYGMGIPAVIPGCCPCLGSYEPRGGGNPSLRCRSLKPDRSYLGDGEYKNGRERRKPSIFSLTD
ncbi:hypothetical protein LDENG_00130390 [Lucifuga dentata]|nr:hypothetical protein LDENG_00130390 [Lucifuga dentata]